MSRRVPAPAAGLVGPLVLLVLLVLPSSAAPTATGVPLADLPAAGATTSAADPTALALLERASRAPATTPYSGVQFVSAWSSHGATSVVVEVVHQPGHGTTVRSDGTAQAPAADTFLPAGNGEPSLLGAATTLTLLAGNYRVQAVGRTTVAGRPADLVEARRSGSGALAARFWLDRATGLVLRREVYDEDGRATRASAFVQVEVGRAAVTPHLPPALPDAWADAVASADLAGMRERGWQCPTQLPGSLTLVDARRGGAPGARILHLSYSDGLAALSLFQQRGRLDEERLEGYRRTEVGGAPVYVRDGVPQRLVWSARGTVFTVVADAPPRTVEGVVGALPHEPADGGGWRRLGRGLDRVASWFNPFG